MVQRKQNADAGLGIEPADHAGDTVINILPAHRLHLGGDRVLD